MSDRSHIEWTDATWQVTAGCSMAGTGMSSRGPNCDERIPAPSDEV